MSAHRPTCLSPEFAVYFGVVFFGFTTLSLLLLNSGLGALWILAIGMAYGWVVDWLAGLGKARVEERRREPSREEVIEA